jgi:hypothetical protein
MVTGGGNVGVGTNTPTSRLQVKGTGSTLATTALRVENANASASMVVLNNGYVGIGTAIPSSSLDITLSGSADKINVTQGGSTRAEITGVGNIIAFANLTAYGNNLSGGGGIFQYNGGYANQIVGHRFKHITGAFTGTSGDQTMVEIVPIMSQSATAGYTGLKVNVTETAVGSGTKSLLDLQVGGSSKFSVSNTGDVTVSGTITAREFKTEFISASIVYASGSHKFGNSSDDIHQFTGSVFINGPVIATSYTGSIFGSASYATRAENAENVYVEDNTTDGQYYLVLVDNNGTYMRLSADKNNANYNPSTGTLTTTQLVETSALRFKENIEPLKGSLKNIHQLEGVYFTKIGESDRKIGFIAENVAETYPELVEYNKEGEVQGLSYQRMTAVLVEAVKELSNKVTAQEIFIRDLESRIKQLEAK